MTLRETDYYSEDALNQRELARTAQRGGARKIREELERQYDAMLSPMKIRSSLEIVPVRALKSSN
jgi:hypothetical protein